jgi:hypothetical protein
VGYRFIIKYFKDLPLSFEQPIFCKYCPQSAIKVCIVLVDVAGVQFLCSHQTLLSGCELLIEVCRLIILSNSHPRQTWELTLLPCARVLKSYMWPSETKIIRLHPRKVLYHPPKSEKCPKMSEMARYWIFDFFLLPFFEKNKSGGCTRVMKCCMQPSVNKFLVLSPTPLTGKC